MENIKIGSNSKLIRGKSTMVSMVMKELNSLIEKDSVVKLNSPFETAAFAYLLKEFCSIICDEPLETFMTQEGKNKIVEFPTRLNLKGMKNVLMKAPIQSLGLKEEDITSLCSQLIMSLDHESMDGTLKNLSAGVLLQKVGEFVRNRLSYVPRIINLLMIVVIRMKPRDLGDLRNVS